MNVLTYRGRKLEVTGQVIKTFEEMEITKEAKVEEHERVIKGEKAGYVSMKSIKADSVSFEVLLLREAGVDVWEEVKGWRALVDGKGARIYFAGNDILGFDMALTECGSSQMKMDGQGTITRAKMKLTFMQTTGAETKKGTGKGSSGGSHSKYHTYVEAWAVNAISKKKTHISTVKSGTRVAGETWKQPTAPTGYIAPTEYRAKQYAKKDCPFCKALEQQKADAAAAAGKAGFIHAFTTEPTE